MTHEEKAKELIDKFKSINIQYVLNGMANEADITDEAKECALICIDEILSAHFMKRDSGYKTFLLKVKEKIQSQ